VLTQYQPLVLNEYIGNGQPWDLDRTHGGVFVLPPYQQSSGSDWYTGTANAIYQNMPFIERYDPDYVLILGGDHIYKMDYSKMLDYHIEKGAACTIAVLEVPQEETSRFGIMNTNEDGSIYEFVEKPPHAISRLASMGIYIFNMKTLRTYLNDDANDPNSSKDFGKNIIPSMLEAKEPLFAYNFDGYWKDVGTLDSLWEANMDLLDPSVPLDLGDSAWRIYARNTGLPPQFIGKTGMVQNSIITEGVEVYGGVDFSVLFPGVTVEEGAIVHDSIIMPGSVSKRGAVVEYSIVAENCEIGENARVGDRPERAADIAKWGIAVIAGGVKVGAGAVVPAKTMVNKDIEAAAAEEVRA
jgi:glucose-1-phosphate adenylyltransferase